MFPILSDLIIRGAVCKTGMELFYIYDLYLGCLPCYDIRKATNNLMVYIVMLAILEVQDCFSTIFHAAFLKSAGCLFESGGNRESKPF